MATLSSGPRSGKLAIVTGANVGIGLETAAGLLERGADVILACRNQERAESAIKLLTDRGFAADRIRFMQIDLADLASVKRFAKNFRDTGRIANIFIANAGLMKADGAVTGDGFEYMFQANHLGHFYLLNMLLKARLIDPSAGRIVIVSSEAARRGKMALDAIHESKTGAMAGFQTYRNTKLYNYLHAQELQRRLRADGLAIDVFALHPGVVNSEFSSAFSGVSGFVARLIFRVFGVSTKDGAATSLFAATDPSLTGKGGLWCEKAKVAKFTNPIGSDPKAQKDLWDLSDGIFKGDYSLD